MSKLNVNALIDRLKVIDAEETIIKSKINDQLDVLNKEREQIKIDLKNYYYSLPKEKLEETKTLRFIKFGDTKLQENLQEPEFVRDEEKLIEWAKKNGEMQYVNEVVKVTFDWSSLKKCIKIEENKVLFGNIEVEGIQLKEREPKFEIKY